MHNSPYFTVNIWMRVGSFLNPRRLIPALMRYDPAKNPKVCCSFLFLVVPRLLFLPSQGDDENHAIRYLKYCVNTLHSEGCASSSFSLFHFSLRWPSSPDEAIHNFLLSLYAQNDMEEELMDFLNSEEPHFDLKYALRLCTQYNARCVVLLNCVVVILSLLLLSCLLPSFQSCHDPHLRSNGSSWGSCRSCYHWGLGAGYGVRWQSSIFLCLLFVVADSCFFSPRLPSLMTTTNCARNSGWGLQSM